MKKLSNAPAYIVWAFSLAAILTPPAIAAAGFEAVLDAQEAVFALVEDEPEPVTPATMDNEEPGWQA